MSNMMVTEDVYFKNKTDEVFEAILSDYKKGCFSDVEIKSYIYRALKEVARDQRYACVDAVNDIFYKYDYTPSISTMEGSIQNAQIKEK